MFFSVVVEDQGALSLASNGLYAPYFSAHLQSLICTFQNVQHIFPLSDLPSPSTCTHSKSACTGTGRDSVVFLSVLVTLEWSSTHGIVKLVRNISVWNCWTSNCDYIYHMPKMPCSGIRRPCHEGSRIRWKWRKSHCSCKAYTRYIQWLRLFDIWAILDHWQEIDMARNELAWYHHLGVP